MSLLICTEYSCKTASKAVHLFAVLVGKGNANFWDIWTLDGTLIGGVDG